MHVVYRCDCYSSRNDSTEKRLTDMLKEKEEMIAGLMEEGMYMYM